MLEGPLPLPLPDQRRGRMEGDTLIVEGEEERLIPAMSG
jgi:hypothetical protein